MSTPWSGDQALGGAAALLGSGKVKPPLDEGAEPVDDRRPGRAARAGAHRRRLRLACLRGERGLSGLELGQLVLEGTDFGAGAGQLAGLGAAEPRHRGALVQEARIGPREPVALREHLRGEDLLADLELAEARGLGRDRPAGRAHLADDHDVLLAHALHEREAFEQVPEARGAQHDGHHVRGVGLVAGHELLGEDLLRVRLVRLELDQADVGGDQLGVQPGQLGALGVEVGLDPCEAARQRGDVRAELPEAARRRAHRARQRRDVALAGVDPLLELALARRSSHRRARSRRCPTPRRRPETTPVRRTQRESVASVESASVPVAASGSAARPAGVAPKAVGRPAR